MPSAKRNTTSQQPTVTGPNIKGPDTKGPEVNAVARLVAAWFNISARDLPWRKRTRGTRNPYAGLVSEAMLQQTQVSRVVEKYAQFMERFPTLRALADAHPDDVTSAWAGLGYYRRARNLHKAAIMIRDQFGGKLPTGLDELRMLPGVGRYTAGALASIVFDQPVPLVDGNVVRVLSRLWGRPGAADDNVTLRWTWDRAGQIAAAAGPEVAACNEGLMELGATICIPGPAPKCTLCPLKDLCIAAREGTQGQIPAPKTAKARERLHIIMLYLVDASGKIALEQRPDSGLWAGLWQPPCLELHDTPPQKIPAWVRSWLSDSRRTGPLSSITLAPLCTLERTLTHRDVTFDIYHGLLPKGKAANMGTLTFGAPTLTSTPRATRIVSPARLHTLGISNAHTAALEAARLAVGTT